MIEQQAFNQRLSALVEEFDPATDESFKCFRNNFDEQEWSFLLDYLRREVATTARIEVFTEAVTKNMLGLGLVGSGDDRAFDGIRSEIADAVYRYGYEPLPSESEKMSFCKLIERLDDPGEWERAQDGLRGAVAARVWGTLDTELDSILSGEEI